MSCKIHYIKLDSQKDSIKLWWDFYLLTVKFSAVQEIPIEVGAESLSEQAKNYRINHLLGGIWVVLHNPNNLCVIFETCEMLKISGDWHFNGGKIFDI